MTKEQHFHDGEWCALCVKRGRDQFINAKAEIDRLREAVALADEITAMRESEARIAERERLRERLALALEKRYGFDGSEGWDIDAAAILAILEDE